MKIPLDNSTNSYYNRVRIRIKGRWDIVEDPYVAVRRLIIAINKIDGSYYFYARKLGVKENTLALLYELDDGHPHSQKQISEDWQIPKTTINTIVKELINDGYAILLPEENSREKTILLTERGQQYAHDLLEKIYSAEQEALKSTLEKYPPEFIDAFERFASCLCTEIGGRIHHQNE